MMFLWSLGLYEV